MRTSGRFVAVIIAQIAAIAPALAAGGPWRSEPRPHRWGFSACLGSPCCGESPGRLEVGSNLALPALETTPATASLTVEEPCGLQTLHEPELLAPASSPPRLFLGHGAARYFPSLGGPVPALTSPDALPGLRDAAAPDDQEDTLRLFRSHW